MKRNWKRVLIKTAFVGALGMALVCTWIVWDMPDINDVTPVEVRNSITVLANDGTVIARYGNVKGDVVKIDAVPAHLRNALIAIEDRRFYSHFGIDPIGLGRAMFENAKAGSWVQGGSTITQQLAKNLFLTPDKTIRRKFQEAVLALWIDFKFSKDEILSAYLNRVYFGSGAYGIDAAADVYYGKKPAELTLWESAVLAGLLKAPSRYSPSSNPKKAEERAKVVVAAMHDAGFIDKKMTERQLKSARVKQTGADAGSLSRYFADWVIDEIDSYATNNDRDLIVKTTLDPDFQIMAENSLKAMTGAGKETGKETKPGEEKAEHPQAALVTMGEDGAVLAMIGGTDYNASQFNRATQAQRQPGSSFKPFVYIAALEAGYQPNTQIEDAPVCFRKYCPQNYDGKYYGTVTLTDALALSLNAATIQLLSNVGVDRMIDVTKRMNFSNSFRPELATGLGAGEASLLEMTDAYATISNGGFPVEPYAVLSIETEKGKVIYKRQRTSQSRVFSSGTMAALDGMLVQVVARGTGQAAQLSRGHVAGKTGTSQDYRDAWFIGYTDNLVTGVWMGNDDNTSMGKVSGGSKPARLWHDYMQGAIGLDLPSFVTTFSAPSSFGSFFGFGDSDYAPQPMANVPQGNGTDGGGFGSMLKYWSSGSGGNDGEVVPNNKPVYNP